MEIALQSAGLKAIDIQHLNAHSTSTPVGDRGEIAAIKSVFGNHDVAVSATKSATGTYLVPQVVLRQSSRYSPYGIKSLPTRNLENPDPVAAGIDLVHQSARPILMEHAISNGFGFGGVNASVAFRRWQ